MKFFQDLNSAFREEDFLRIFSCPFSASSPHSPEPYLLTDYNFTNNFWKKSPKKEHQRRFFRNSSCLYSAISPYSLQPCLLTDRNFSKIFKKRVTQGKFLWNCFKIGPAVSEKIFLRISSCPYSDRSPHSPEPCLWMDQTSFEKGNPRNIPVKLFQNWTSGSREEDF